MTKENHPDTYVLLLSQIGDTLTMGRRQAYQAVNTSLLKTYWEIGRHIVEYEQKGHEKSDYGSHLLERLTQDLRTQHGEVFSRSSLVYIRKLYLLYPIGESVIHQLTWTHFIELLKIEDPLERSFYERQSVLDRWSVRELKRQKKTALFQRLALSRDKKGVLQLVKEGRIVASPQDLTRDPYILEFLQIPEQHRYSESELEDRIIEQLQQFLLEMGKGFAFIGRQYRITLNNKHYRVDLVFYHRILKCFVLIDLKLDDVDHGDIGQMNLYLNFFKREENMPDDHEPIGIILSRNKDEVLVEYALGGLANQIFVSRYQLYLPDRAMLEEKLRLLLEE